MALSDMQVFEQYAYGSMTETINQQTELFNQASAGAITLTNVANEGDFSSETFWKEISGLTRRRNAYGSGAVAGVALSQDKQTSVKIAGGTPPILFTNAQFSWIQKLPDEAGVIIGEQIGKAKIADYLNSSIAASVAAITNNTDVTHTSAAPAKRTDLVDASGKFGDAASNIGVWVCHSKTMNDIFKENLQNNATLFKIENVNLVQDGFGRVFLVTDSPSLHDETNTNYITLGLVSGGVGVEDNNDFTGNLETSNGDENIKRSYQAEYSFNIRLKGYSWDTASGGKSPTDAQIATGANWNKIASSNKSTAGVALISK